MSKISAYLQNKQPFQECKKEVLLLLDQLQQQINKTQVHLTKLKKDSATEDQFDLKSFMSYALGEFKLLEAIKKKLKKENEIAYDTQKNDVLKLIEQKRKLFHAIIPQEIRNTVAYVPQVADAGVYSVSMPIKEKGWEAIENILLLEYRNTQATDSSKLKANENQDNNKGGEEKEKNQEKGDKEEKGEKGEKVEKVEKEEKEEKREAQSLLFLQELRNFILEQQPKQMQLQPPSEPRFRRQSSTSQILQPERIHSYILPERKLLRQQFGPNYPSRLKVLVFLLVVILCLGGLVFLGNKVVAQL